MNKINWKIRLQNPQFFITLVPALALLVQTFMAVFNVSVDFSAVSDRMLVFINALFAVLMIIGVVADPTTSGFSDSARALGYTKPNSDK